MIIGDNDTFEESGEAAKQELDNMVTVITKMYKKKGTGIVGIIITSDLIVDSAVYIAEAIHISQKIIAMTIIVIGTSLPELTITVLSAKKGEFDMAIGNIIGTNIFNICVVLGLPITIFGTVSSSAFNLVDMVVVLLAALLLNKLIASIKDCCVLI